MHDVFEMLKLQEEAQVSGKLLVKVLALLGAAHSDANGAFNHGRKYGSVAEVSQTLHGALRALELRGRQQA